MRLHHRLKFRFDQRVKGFEVPDSPWFDSVETTEWFTNKLAPAKRYLEFGTGGSTFLAAKLGVDFSAVDSDPYFLRNLQKKIRTAGHDRNTGQRFYHADIGPTGPWGYPVGPISAERLRKFRRYSDVPQSSTCDELVPDLVLVDGRFRVACALKTLRLLAETENWTLVVDDYTNRPSYHIIAEFAHLERVVGRMAVFTAPRNFEARLLEVAINCYEIVPD
jgi:hypothetical protein